MLFLGLVVLTAFIFNFIYLGILYPSASLLISGSLSSIISGMSILMVFLLIGYLRPEKGAGKNVMFGFSILGGFFFVVFVSWFVDSVPAAGDWLYLSFWGLGGSILTAAGFSMMHNYEESYSPGIMDTSKLHYGPEPEPEPESEVEEAEVVSTESEAPTASDSPDPVETTAETAKDAETE
jgi:hypothetical protein